MTKENMNDLRMIYAGMTGFIAGLRGNQSVDGEGKVPNHALDYLEVVIRQLRVIVYKEDADASKPPATVQ